MSDVPRLPRPVPFALPTLRPSKPLRPLPPRGPATARGGRRGARRAGPQNVRPPGRRTPALIAPYRDSPSGRPPLLSRPASVGGDAAVCLRAGAPLDPRPGRSRYAEAARTPPRPDFPIRSTFAVLPRSAFFESRVCVINCAR